VAAFLVVLWATFVGVWHVRPSVGGEIMLIPVIFLCLAIPVTVGIISTAEERRLGVHEWQLTLPVSAARQWTVKVLATLGVNALLGLLLPLALAWLASLGFDTEHVHYPQFDDGWTAFAIINLLLLASAIHASAASSNSLRALIGTVAIFAGTAFVFLTVAQHTINWRELPYSLAAPILKWLQTIPVEKYDSVLKMALTHALHVLLGVFCAAQCYAGYKSFRQTLGSLRQPALRVALIYCGVIAFFFCIRLLEVAEGMAMRAGWK
jgi:ABC-type Na+ efflux pump permease subunit